MLVGDTLFLENNRRKRSDVCIPCNNGDSRLHTLPWNDYTSRVQWYHPSLRDTVKAVPSVFSTFKHSLPPPSSNSCILLSCAFTSSRDGGERSFRDLLLQSLWKRKSNEHVCTALRTFASKFSPLVRISYFISSYRIGFSISLSLFPALFAPPPLTLSF